MEEEIMIIQIYKQDHEYITSTTAKNRKIRDRVHDLVLNEQKMKGGND